jgi:hypothetical protein
MAEEKLASFNPDDASGLLDNARVTIKKVVVDFFNAKSGSKFVNVTVGYEGGGQSISENYMLGGADLWAPNAAKTGAIPVTEGGKVWNKSDVFKLVKSLIDAGFPKNLIGGDLSVIEGTEVHVNRVTQEGATYTDKDGKERQRTTLLVTKIYTEQALLGKTKGGAVAGKAAKVTTEAAATTAAAGDDNDAFATEILVGILEGADGKALPKDKLKQPAFLLIMKAKKAAIRDAVIARLQNDDFLGSLAEAGLVTYDGGVVTLAA